MTAIELANKFWNEFKSMAEWERFDFVDPPYTWDCNISLSIMGYSYEGWGQEGLTEREILELECTAPDGTKIKIV